MTGKTKMVNGGYVDKDNCIELGNKGVTEIRKLTINHLI